MKKKRIMAVLFDFDGTLSLPGAIDFERIKEEIGCPVQIPILEFIETLPTHQERKNAHRILERHEDISAESSRPNKGAEEIISVIRKKQLPLGIITRNRLECIHRSLENFKETPFSFFDTIITRETPVRHKPSGEGILFFSQMHDIPASHILVVGDYLFDIQAGREAGAMTVFIDNGDPFMDCRDIEPHFRISSLTELESIIDERIPLRKGKVPSRFLDSVWNQIQTNDPSILIPPRAGEDTAAADIRSDEVLVLKSDPITFTTDAAGRYAVIVNGNDIATSGATPRWFLSTLLFPEDTCAFEIKDVIDELLKTCAEHHITLCGGHTEITDSVKRPVVIGMMAGTVLKKNLKDKKNVRTHDRILLTKKIATEGTAIISHAFEERLIQKGVPSAIIQSAKNLTHSISIRPEATIAASIPGVTSMHDITEGGFATAIRELSTASQHILKIHLDKIPVYRETELLCHALDIHPLGLIGSGSLLLTCTPPDHSRLVEALTERKIEVTDIGEVMEQGNGVAAYFNLFPCHLPEFEVDEVAGLFQ